MFAMVPCVSGSWCINTLEVAGNYKLFGNVNGVPLHIFAEVDTDSEWDALSSTP
jgi:hypothetical protein